MLTVARPNAGRRLLPEGGSGGIRRRSLGNNRNAGAVFIGVNSVRLNRVLTLSGVTVATMFALRPRLGPIDDARARLGLAAGSTDAAALTAAFRKAALAAHPDRPGGDAEGFRAVVEAYRLLKTVTGRELRLAPSRTAQVRRAASAQSGILSATIEIDPLTAVRGGLAPLNVRGRARQAQVPAGVRTGDRLRLMLKGGDVVLAKVRIAPSEGLAVEGADLCQNVPIHPRKLAEGGRFTVDTHAGPRDLWLARIRPAPLRYVMNDLGLPSLNGRPAGRLVIRLVPSAAEPTPAEAMLDRFEADWAAPLAA